VTDAKKFCHACGTQILQAAEICPNCGVRQTPPAPTVSDEGASGPVKAATFCFPIIGLILYIVWQDSKPKAAKDVCNWALISVGVGFALYFLMLIIGVAAA
jgi:hypothetical protein